MKAFKKGDDWGVQKRTATFRTACALFNIGYSSHRLIAAARKAIQSFHDPLILAQHLYQMEFLAHSLVQYSFVDVFYNAPTRNSLIKAFTSLISLLVVIPAWQSALCVVHKNDQYTPNGNSLAGTVLFPLAAASIWITLAAGLTALWGSPQKMLTLSTLLITSASGSTSEQSVLSLSGA
jgi:hypothetical protein